MLKWSNRVKLNIAERRTCWFDTLTLLLRKWEIIDSSHGEPNEITTNSPIIRNQRRMTSSSEKYQKKSFFKWNWPLVYGRSHLSRLAISHLELAQNSEKFTHFLRVFYSSIQHVVLITQQHGVKMYRVRTYCFSWWNSSWRRRQAKLSQCEDRW